MPQAAARLALGMLLVLASGCIGYRPYQGPELGIVARGVAARVESVREQPFASMVQVESVGREELEGFVDERLSLGYSLERLERESRTLARLGLYPERRDFGRQGRDLLLTTMVGFYDPIRDRLGLVQPALRRGQLETELALELVLAHELTHALQDQRRDLYAVMAEAAEHGSDAHLATMALIEGEAQAVMYGYLLGGSGKELADVDAPLGDATLGRLDPMTSHFGHAHARDPMEGRLLLFPYLAGATFVQAVHQHGGWSAVDRLFEPGVALSTEQILHPEKLLESLDRPVTVVLPPLELPGWAPYHEDTIGELAIRAILERRLGEEESVAAAIGWDGDRIAVYERGATLAYAWVTAWDSEEDAEEFAASFHRALTARLGGAEPTHTATWRTPAGAVACEHRGDLVAIVEGFDNQETEALATALRRTTRRTAPGDDGRTDAASSRRAQERSLLAIRARRGEDETGIDKSGDTLHDPRHGFRLARPSSRRWHFVTTPATSVRRARLQRLDDLDPDLLVPHRYANVDVVPLTLPLDIEQIVRQTERQLAFTLRNFKKLGEQVTTIDGESAIELQYRGSLGTTAMRFRQLTFLRQAHQYSLTLASPVNRFDEDAKDFDTIVESFRFE